MIWMGVFVYQQDSISFDKASKASGQANPLCCWGNIIFESLFCRIICRVDILLLHLGFGFENKKCSKIHCRMVFCLAFVLGCGWVCSGWLIRLAYLHLLTTDQNNTNQKEKREKQNKSLVFCLFLH